jgi:hypothetical protein
MLVCGFVVALCLALTLLIVWLAGSRGSGGTRSSLPAVPSLTARPGAATLVVPRSVATTNPVFVLHPGGTPVVPPGGQP